MTETIEQMTCEELTAAYVILRNLETLSKDVTDIKDFKSFANYISHLKRVIVISHEEKLEYMRREFYEGE